MNLPLLAAAALTGLTVLAHIIGGTPEYLVPILQSNSPQFNKVGMEVIWHWVTAAMSANAIGLLAAARKPAIAMSVSALVTAQFMAFGLVFLVYGLTEFGSPFPMPQWIAFFLISTFAAWGALK